MKWFNVNSNKAASEEYRRRWVEDEGRRLDENHRLMKQVIADMESGLNDTKLLKKYAGQIEALGIDPNNFIKGARNSFEKRKKGNEER